MISLSSLVALFANAEMHVLVRDGDDVIRRPVDLREWAPGEVVSLVIEGLADAPPAPKVDGWTLIVVSDDAVRYDRDAVGRRIDRAIARSTESGQRGRDLAWLWENGDGPVVDIIRIGRERGDSEAEIIHAIRG